MDNYDIVIGNIKKLKKKEIGNLVENIPSLGIAKLITRANIIDLVKKLTDEGLDSLNIYILLFAITEDFNEVKKIFQLLYNQNIAISPEVFSKMLEFTDNFYDAIYVIETMKSIGIVPNKHNYSRCIQLAKTSVTAKALMQEMKDNNLDFIPAIFAYLINLQSNYKDARIVFEEAKAINCFAEPLYYYLINKTENPSQFDKVKLEMEQKGLRFKEHLCQSFKKSYHEESINSTRKAYNFHFIKMYPTSIEILLSYLDSKESTETSTINSNTNVEFLPIDDVSDYPEGAKAYRTHTIAERNPQVIKKAKERFAFFHNGNLFCEACGFNFNEIYGSRGNNFIEGHHKKLVSEMQKGETTKIEDIALLCSNCHRMIHRKPLISVEELSALLKRTTKKETI